MDNYRATAQAMFEAGEALLPVQARNACYLLGYVAECALKQALHQAGINPRRFGHRVNELAEAFDQLALAPSSRLPALGRVREQLRTMLAAPTRWHPDDRYDGRRWTPTVAMRYRDEADKMMQILADLQLEGRL